MGRRKEGPNKVANAQVKWASKRQGASALRGKDVPGKDINGSHDRAPRLVSHESGLGQERRSNRGLVFAIEAPHY
jgi:hypothetical protein